MEVHVLFFGQPRAVAGREEETVVLEGGARLIDLLRTLVALHPGLDSELKDGEGVMILVNGRNHHSLAGVGTLLRHGDQVAILPVTIGG